MEKKCGWMQPNRLLVVQTGESVNQAKVFKAQAVPQGLCGNLINALKLPANQQEDGDGFIQNIVTTLGEGSRKGLTNGLRNFIPVDNHRALQVGHLNEGMGKYNVRRPKGSAGCPKVTVRESPDELTLRAEEVGSWKSDINVDHTEKDGWGQQPQQRQSPQQSPPQPPPPQPLQPPHHTAQHNNTQHNNTQHNNTQQHTTTHNNNTTTHNNTQQHTTTHNNTQQHTTTNNNQQQPTITTTTTTPRLAGLTYRWRSVASQVLTLVGELAGEARCQPEPCTERYTLGSL